jgi:hypothetical protein
VACQFLDECDVSTGVEQRRAIGVAEQVRRELLCDRGLVPKRLEELGHVIAGQAPGVGASRYEQRRMIVSSHCSELLHPVQAYRRKEHGSRLVAFTDNFDLTERLLEDVAIE